MNKKTALVCVLASSIAFALAFTGCDRVKQFNNLIDGGTEALMKEDASYRTLKTAAQERGERSLTMLQAWVGTLKNLSAVMVEASGKLKGKNEAKIRADKDVQAALARFKNGVDEVLGRNYAEATLKLVPPWRLEDAKSIVSTAPTALRQISAYYESVFATANAYAGKMYSIEVLEDTAILDTVEPCIAKVEALAKSQAKNSYCVTAARRACGHQIDVGCVDRGVRAALLNNTCPEVKTVTYKIAANETFRPERYIDTNTEEVKEWKYGATVTEANPDRAFGTFCPSNQYDAKIKGVQSSTYCGMGPRVRIYGFNGERHVLVEIEGVKHTDNARKDVIVDIYAEGDFVGTRVIRPDHGWNGNVYAFEITERAFQMNSMVRLQFRDLVDVSFTDENGQYHSKKVHWIVDAQIKGEDVPFIKKREVHLTKYMPNTWVGGIVQSCASSSPILK